MLLMKKCPRCGSTDIRLKGFMGIETIECSNCHFDESRIYDVFPGEKPNQKVKGRYSPYKAGGSQRTRKK